MKKISKIAFIFSLVFSSLGMFSAQSAMATTASGVYLYVTCPNGASNGVYYKTSSTVIPEEGFARSLGGSNFSFGIHDVPESVHLNIGCGSGTWWRWADIYVFKSPTQYFSVNCVTTTATGRCSAY